MAERQKQKIVDQIFTDDNVFFAIPWDYPIEKALSEFDHPEQLDYIEAATPVFRSRFIHRRGQPTEPLLEMIQIADQVSVERGINEEELDLQRDWEIIQSIRNEAERRFQDKHPS